MYIRLPRAAGHDQAHQAVDPMVQVVHRQPPLEKESPTPTPNI